MHCILSSTEIDLLILPTEKCETIVEDRMIIQDDLDQSNILIFEKSKKPCSEFTDLNIKEEEVIPSVITVENLKEKQNTIDIQNSTLERLLTVSNSNESNQNPNPENISKENSECNNAMESISTQQSSVTASMISFIDQLDLIFKNFYNKNKTRTEDFERTSKYLINLFKSKTCEILNDFCDSEHQDFVNFIVDDIPKFFMWKYGKKFKSIILEIKLYCEKNLRFQYNLYDSVIKELDNVKPNVKEQEWDDVYTDPTRFHVYRHLLLFCINECGTNFEIIKMIYLDTDIIKQNITDGKIYTKKYSKFIFEDLIYNFVNSLRLSDNGIVEKGEYSENDIEIFTSLIDFIHCISDAAAKSHIISKIENETYFVKYNQDKTFNTAERIHLKLQQKYNNDVKMSEILDKLYQCFFKDLESFQNNTLDLTWHEAIDLSYAMNTDTALDQRLYLNLVPFTHDDLMFNTSEFVGLLFDSQKSICPYSQTVMIQPIYYGEVDTLCVDRLGIITDFIYQKLSKNWMSKYNIFTLKNPLTNIDIPDIREFSFHAELNQIAESFIKRSRSFACYNDSASLKVLESMFINEKMTFCQIVESVVLNFFDICSKQEKATIFKNLDYIKFNHFDAIGNIVVPSESYSRRTSNMDLIPMYGYRDNVRDLAYDSVVSDSVVSDSVVSDSVVSDSAVSDSAVSVGRQVKGSITPQVNSAALDRLGRHGIRAFRRRLG